MMNHKRRVLMAVRLLDQIISEVRKQSASSRGSPGRLLVRLVRLRELLDTELKQPEASWRAMFPLFREAVRLVAELIIDNLPYIFCPWRHGLDGYRFCP